MDIHSKQDGLNRPVDRPGNIIVSARSTFPLLNSSLWLGDFSFRNDTMGDRAKLAGDIHTNGAGIPRPEGLSWIGKPTVWPPPPEDLGSSPWIWPLNLRNH